MKNIDELSKELYDDVMSEYNAQSEWDRKSFSEILDDRLNQYNDDVAPIIMSGVYNEVKNVFKSGDLPDVILKEPQLSDMLYKNKKRVQSDTIAILNDGIKAKKTIGSMSKKLYDGYSFNDSEVLQIRKKLPKYLQRELKKRKTSAEFIKYVDNIKTKPLKTALKQISDKMHTINQKGLENAIRVALEEKSRYYAKRIADTEHHRAVNIARAKSYIEDDELEFVKHQMNSRHPMIDICDYYDKLDVGYGAGVYKKEDMISLPHHPHCRCRYIPHYDKVKKRDVKNPEKDTLERFRLNDRRNILGSHNKLQKFYDGESVESIFNMSRPKYPIRKYSDVFRYNSEMKTLKSDYLSYNKSGYYDSIGLTEGEKSEILSHLGVNHGDINDIVKKTAYKVEGAVIYKNAKRYEIIGKFKDRVEVPVELLHNAHVIHSHPLGESFSVEDILEVVKNKSKSIVAFNDEYIYKMTNNIQLENEKFRDMVVSAIDKTDAVLQEKVKRGIITKSQKDFAINHKVWQEVSRKVKGFDYEAFKFKK